MMMLIRDDEDEEEEEEDPKKECEVRQQQQKTFFLEPSRTVKSKLDRKMIVKHIDEYYQQDETELDIGSMLHTLLITKEDTPIQDEKTRHLKSQLQYKIDGYRRQDMAKSLFPSPSSSYSSSSFVTLEDVCRLLYASELRCDYCRRRVKCFYRNVREPSQWTLDRIDNTQGHLQHNVVIACLSCNISRRTSHHIRFKNKHQFQITKVGGYEEEE